MNKVAKPVSVEVGFDTAARTFIEQLNQGVRAWAAAGQILAQMVDQDHNAFNRIRQIAPHISHDVLVAFEKIGRKKIYPYLLLDNSPGMKRLAQLPYADQERYHQEKIKVVRAISLRGPVIDEKRVSELSAQQAELAIGHSAIRTVQEQEKLLRQLQNGKHAQPRSPRVSDNVVSKFVSIGYFRLTVSKLDGKPTLLKSSPVDGAGVIEIKTNAESGIGSNTFEIRVDKNLTASEEEIPEPEHGLNSALANQIEELTRRRAELTALLRSKPEKKQETEKAIKEINRKIASLQSIG